MFRLARAPALAIGALGFAIAALSTPPESEASQLVYQPINPAFGGDPFAGSFLIETARDQNRHARDEQMFPDINIPDFDFDMPPIIIAPNLTGGTQNGGDETLP